jgi:iron complex outermembrane receptor protein
LSLAPAHARGDAQGRGAPPSTLVRPEEDPDAPPRQDGPAQVRVISRDEILGRGPRRSLSLAAVLEGEPGTTVTSAGGPGQYSAVLLRGAAPTQVLVLLDGVPLNRGALGAVDLSLLPVEGLERIEVYRGVPPLELGSDAIGGAIHLISRRAKGRSRPGLQLLPAVGSFGLRRAAASYAARHEDLRVAASVLYQGAQGDFPHYYDSGYALSDARHGEVLRRNNHFDQAAASVVLSTTRGPLSLRLVGQGFLKRQGVPAFGQPGAAATDPDLTTARGLLLFGLRRDLLGGRLTLDLEAHGLLVSSSFRSATRRGAPDRSEGAPPRDHRELLSPEAGGQASLRARRLGPVSLLALLEARGEFARSSDLCPAPRTLCPAPLTRSDRLRLGAALGADLHLLRARLALQPGLHVLYARSSLRPLAGMLAAKSDEPQAAQDTFVSPRLLARLRVRAGAPSILLRAGAGRFVRLPTFLELFGDGGLFAPAIGLRPESAWTVEAGGALHGDAGPVSLRGEAAGFARLVSDLIVVGNSGDRLRSQNIGEARIFGVEMDLHAALRDLVAVRATYTFLDARSRSPLPAYEGRLLPRRPQHSAVVRVDAGYRAWHAFYELAHASLAYQDEANLQPMPARTLHTLGLRIGPHGPGRVALSIEVHNLLDTRTVTLPPIAPGGPERTVALSDYYDFPLPGRSILCALAAEL